jgi:hypothetical protein
MTTAEGKVKEEKGFYMAIRIQPTQQAALLNKNQKTPQIETF